MLYVIQGGNQGSSPKTLPALRLVSQLCDTSVTALSRSTAERPPPPRMDQGFGLALPLLLSLCLFALGALAVV